MKIAAILGRGRKKGFWDLDILLREYNLQQVIDFYEEKFHEQLLLIRVPEAIIYFTDAEDSETPVSLNGQTWEKVKKVIEKK